MYADELQNREDRRRDRRRNRRCDNAKTRKRIQLRTSVGLSNRGRAQKDVEMLSRQFLFFQEEDGDKMEPREAVGMEGKSDRWFHRHCKIVDMLES